MKKKPIKGTIEDWQVFYCKNPNHFHIYGVFKEDDSDDPSEIVTTSVLNIEDGIAETLNSFYKLGKPALSAGDLVKVIMIQ